MKIRSACELLLPKTYADIWARGESYADADKIKLLKNTEKECRATALGTETYSVSLYFAGGKLGRKCSCPYAANSACKHEAAAAILWDELRGLKRPERPEIELTSIPPPLVSKSEIRKAFENPLNAELEIVRLIAEDGNYFRAHARLPLAPKIILAGNCPATKEVARLFAEIKSWCKRPAYDKHFCAGEMVAAYCEVLRALINNVSECAATEATEILLLAQQFHRKLIIELTDSPDNLHEFTEAHLETLLMAIKKLRVPKTDKGEVDQKLWEYDLHQDDF